MTAITSSDGTVSIDADRGLVEALIEEGKFVLSGPNRPGDRLSGKRKKTQCLS